MTMTEPTQDEWQKKMAVRQDPSQFDMARLLASLLNDHWMHECEILPAYVPPRAETGRRPECRVRYVREDRERFFLRYSKGPLQGYFWDAYGDDMHDPELAVVAISRSPAPPGVSVIQTHGR
jgi:hypothetical protein